MWTEEARWKVRFKWCHKIIILMNKYKCKERHQWLDSHQREKEALQNNYHNMEWKVCWTQPHTALLSNNLEYLDRMLNNTLMSSMIKIKMRTFRSMLKKVDKQIHGLKIKSNHQLSHKYNRLEDLSHLSSTNLLILLLGWMVVNFKTPQILRHWQQIVQLILIINQQY